MSDGYVKIWFEEAHESCWAKKVGDNLYTVENIPFFIEDVSLHDIVEALEVDERLCYTKIMGKKTYKIGIKYNKEEVKLQENWETICKHLNKHDIQVEGATAGLCMIAYDISKTIDDITHIINECPIALEVI